MTECAICLELLNNNIAVLNCKHEFHYKCIKNWINKKKSSNFCPFCVETDNKIIKIKNEVINVNDKSLENLQLRLFIMGFKNDELNFIALQNNNWEIEKAIEWIIINSNERPIIQQNISNQRFNRNITNQYVNNHNIVNQQLGNQNRNNQQYVIQHRNNQQYRINQQYIDNQYSNTQNIDRENRIQNKNKCNIL